MENFNRKVERMSEIIINNHYPYLPKWINKEIFYFTKMKELKALIFKGARDNLLYIDITNIIGLPLRSKKINDGGIILENKIEIKVPIFLRKEYKYDMELSETDIEDNDFYEFDIFD